MTSSRAMLAVALSFYRRRFGALVLTCALALLPTQLLMSGAVVLGFASLGAGGLSEAHPAAAPPPQSPDVAPEKPPAPEASALRMQPAGSAAAPGSTFDPGALPALLPMAFALLCAVVVLLCGLSLAHAAAVPLALGTARRPAAAWAAVAGRLHGLIWTAIQGVPLIALGLVLFVLPGMALAVGFAFAMPVVMCEGLSGRAALERSWALCRGRRAQVFGMLALIAAFTALGSAVSLLAPAGPWRAMVSGAVRLVAYPLPLLGLVLLYQRAVSTSAAAPRPDSSERGSPGSPRL